MRLFGLGKALRELFQRPFQDDVFYEDLEDALVEADLGGKAATEVVTRLRLDVKTQRAATREEAMELLGDTLRGMVIARQPEIRRGSLNIILVLGVNGVGKTTTIAKLARYYHVVVGIPEVVLAAADTFRAAAVEQLSIWGERLGVRVVRQDQGSDPGAVIHDAVTSALAKGAELLIVDTAGRLHTKTQLVKELEKLDRIARARMTGGAYTKLLVIDATTGQNALRQAEVFHGAVGVDGLVLSKYDSTAKGGILVQICRDLGLPVSFVGTGEKPSDLEPFDPSEYARALVGGGEPA